MKTMRHLLDAGTDVNARDVAGRTVLHICVGRLCNRVTAYLARILVEEIGADVLAKDRFGMIPLDHAKYFADENSDAAVAAEFLEGASQAEVARRCKNHGPEQPARRKLNKVET